MTRTTVRKDQRTTFQYALLNRWTQANRVGGSAAPFTYEVASDLTQAEAPQDPNRPTTS